MGMILSELSVISQGSPDSTRINEDASYFCGDNDELYILVVDGASVRVSTPTLERAIAAYADHTTAASYAARLTRDTVASAIASSMSGKTTPSPASLLLNANSALQARIEEVFGGLTSDAVLRAEPELDILREDPRLIRLVLPICVATVACINLSTSTLHFAHAGDTALFVKYTDGSVVRVTGDSMEAHDRGALSAARRKQQADENLHIVDLLSDEETLSLNRRNGLFHNYVDENGRTNSSVGVGVINGLPELAEYIQHGILDLTGVDGVLACSDGFIWPSVWDETEAQTTARLQQMWQLIGHDGLHGYVRQLRTLETEDHQMDKFPRFKLHDDATAIYAELQHE